MFQPYVRYTLDDLLTGGSKFNYAKGSSSLVLEDHGEHYAGSVAIPGALREDIKVSVRDNILEVKYEPTNKNKFAAAFKNSWQTVGLNTDDVKADYVNGVLTVVVPKAKKPEPKVKTIQVN